MRGTTILAAGALFAVIGCSSERVGAVDLTPADSVGSIAVSFGASMDGLPRDSYGIEEARIDGDTLRVRLVHGGGCTRHEYGLAAVTGWMESHPVQVGVLILHNAHGDMCRALLRPELRFDLNPLRRAYVEAYQQHSATIVINLMDPSGTSSALRSLHYTF